MTRVEELRTSARESRARESRLMSSSEHLTSAGKEALRKTVRKLRETLLTELLDAVQREYRLDVTADKARLLEAKAKKRARLEAWLDEQGQSEWPLAAGKQSAKAASKKPRPGKGAQPEVVELAPGPARVRPSEKRLQELRAKYLKQGVKEAAHTLLNRLVIVRLLEQAGLLKPALVSGGFNSPAYREYAAYAGALCSDDRDGSKGYASLLQLVYDELALELPGVFGNVGLTRLYPVPPGVLREVIEALNDPQLDSAWRDDTTLGWVYQFWNDPEREALDAKVGDGGKIEPHEVAAKTQLFTERYMVEWLLQNSLGQTWLAICKKHGWTPDFEQVRGDLETRRAAWRKQREAGEVAADALMPLYSPLEEQWKYWVPQPLPEDAVASAPTSLRELKLLDPACGSGHFLVIAFTQLAALYEEEARHQGVTWSREQITCFIVEENLHGIDIDPRAVQIAAAAVWLAAKTYAPQAKFARLNLVAPTFKLSAVTADDPALRRLAIRLEAEVGIPQSLTRQLVAALDGVDHLGSLLRVGPQVRAALESYESTNFGLSSKKPQGELFTSEQFHGETVTRITLSLDEAVERVMTQLGRFLSAHERESDLGLRLEGQQLAAGVRFVQLARENAYDVVVGNPPYQGTSKMAEAKWFAAHYPRGKADLYACFLERGLELAKPGGVSALITMRGWMFLSTFESFREHLKKNAHVASLGDLGWGAFRDMRDNPVTMSVLCNARSSAASVALAPNGTTGRSRTQENFREILSGLRTHLGRYEFDVGKLAGIEGTPLVYWWDATFLDEYIKAPKLGEIAPAKFGANTGDNTRFLRVPWEVCSSKYVSEPIGEWVPYVKGAKGLSWFEPLRTLVYWRHRALELTNSVVHNYGEHGERWKLSNSGVYFTRGVAFSMIGSEVTARLHRMPSVIGDKGSSCYSVRIAETVCSMNSTISKSVLQSLNPSVSFQVGDVLRLPFVEVQYASRVVKTLHVAFTQHESHREASVEFKCPGPSPWVYAQDWAQRAVDRATGEPLPPYEPVFDAPEPASYVSFAIGVALGRFGENGEGILDLSLPSAPRLTAQAERRNADAPRAGAPKTNSSSVNRRGARGNEPFAHATEGAPEVTEEGLDADGLPAVPNIEPSPLPEGQVILPDGILFVSALPHLKDSTQHAAFKRVEDAWREHAGALLQGKKSSLEEWLRKDFFPYHKALYENRPIYFPLSSEGRNFVAFVSIHRWHDSTLQALLAGYLLPAQKQLQGEIADLNMARASSDKKQKADAERAYARTHKLLEELDQFIVDVAQCAEKGPKPVEDKGAKCPPREVDAPFVMDLDDGVMINSAALWPLLLPQWKDPKKWWQELASAQGRKDYDWAHLAKRYFPTRVDEKCKTDPSLAVAHGCFWKYHPAKAYAWELRLQDEIAPDFTIDEGAANGADSDAARAAFLAAHPDVARELVAKEEQRRERNRKKAERGEAASGDDVNSDVNVDEELEQPDDD